jgi:hypothetical protein
MKKVFSIRYFCKLLLLSSIIYSLFTFHLNDNLSEGESADYQAEYSSIEADFYLFSTQLRYQIQEILDGTFDEKLSFFLNVILSTVIGFFLFAQFTEHKLTLYRFINLPPPPRY